MPSLLAVVASPHAVKVQNTIEGVPVWVVVVLAFLTPLATVWVMRRQLIHDRRMRDRDAIRELLDEALTDAMTLNHSILEINGRLNDLNLMAASPAAKIKPEMEQVAAIDTMIHRSYKELAVAAPNTQRVRLHLPDGDEVVESLWELTAALMAYREEVVTWFREIYSGGHREVGIDHTDKDAQRVDAALNAYAAACRTWSDKAAESAWSSRRHAAEGEPERVPPLPRDT